MKPSTYRNSYQAGLAITRFHSSLKGVRTAKLRIHNDQADGPINLGHSSSCRRIPNMSFTNRDSQGNEEYDACGETSLTKRIRLPWNLSMSLVPA